MRSACVSLNTARTARLMSCALSRSWPSGFSSTMRTLGPFKPACAELFADLREQVRAGGEVEHHRIGRAVAPLPSPVHRASAQPDVVRRLRQVDAQVVQQRGEARELVVAGPLRELDVLEALAQPAPIAVVGVVVARDRKDASTGGQLAVAEGLEQRGHQLAPREVAGAADDDEIERHALRPISRRSRPAVERIEPAAVAAATARRGSRSLHSALPSSTPHWSKLLMPHSAPLREDAVLVERDQRAEAARRQRARAAASCSVGCRGSCGAAPAPRRSRSGRRGRRPLGARPRRRTCPASAPATAPAQLASSLRVQVGEIVRRRLHAMNSTGITSVPWCSIWK